MRTPRRSWLFSALTTSALAAGLCAPFALAGPADAAPTASKLRASAYQFLLTFDNRESLRSGTRVVDASGHRHGGLVVTESAKLTAKPGIARRGAQFPHRGRAIVQIPSGKGLNPKQKSFIFGAALRVGAQQAVTGSNIVQKGFYNQSGGQYKLQLAGGGVPVCVVFGNAGRVKAVATRGVANGRWHRVSCSRTPTGVTVWIDGKRSGSTAGLTGGISNTSPIKVGGKKVSAGNKQFRGRVDNVYMRFVGAPR
jgi:Laminin G domain